MRALKTRSFSEGVAHHRQLPVRVYEDGLQAERIAASRRMVQKCLGSLRPTIVEPCCGTADISGPFSKDADVLGCDCNLPAIECARQRFPLGKFFHAWDVAFDRADVIVLCETLEHMENPIQFAGRWLPKAKFSVISHPLDEALDSELSGGDHQWSFSEQDFDNWFAVGGHELLEKEIFQMGPYQIILGRGQNCVS